MCLGLNAILYSFIHSGVIAGRMLTGSTACASDMAEINNLNWILNLYS
jgi:hypothetical protein